VLAVGGDQTTSVHGYWKYGPNVPTGANANLVASTAMTSYGTHFHPLMSATAALKHTEVTDLSDPSGAIGTAIAASGGARPGDELPASASVLINFPIARRYRGGKPRVYVPAGVATDVVDPQHWDTAFAQSCQTAWQTLSTDVIGAINSWGSGGGQVNVSYYAGRTWVVDHLGNYHRVPTPRDVPRVDDIVSVQASTVIGSQRRRLHPN
jgi:hypothetical protein